MSAFTKPRNLAIAAGTLGALYFVVPGLRTRGVRNVEDRWTAAGGHPTHTPAISTKRGDPNNVENDEVNPSGINSTQFKERISDQKLDPSAAGKKWNKLHYDNEKGK